MPTTRPVATYPVEVPGSLRILGAGLFLLLAASGVAALVRATSSPAASGWLLAGSLLWLGGLTAALLRVLALPTRIEIGPDGVASFVCPTRVVRVPLSTILAVRRTGGPLGLLVVAHDRGSVRFTGRIGGADDFVTRVKAASTRAAFTGL